MLKGPLRRVPRDPQMTVAESHELAERVERQIRAEVTAVTEVLVHVGAVTLHQ